MDFAKQVALFSAIAEKKGMVNSLEGNLSVIDRATGNIYITPSHKTKLLLQPEQICVVNPAGEQIGGTFFGGEGRILVVFHIGYLKC